MYLNRYMGKSPQDDEHSIHILERLHGFIPLVLLAETIGLVSLGLILAWAFNFNNGFDFSNLESKFNWHPLCMFLGLIYFMGNAILIFRILRDLPKKKLKLLHASTHTAVCILAAFAIYVVIDGKNKRNLDHFHTVHSWIGLFTLGLFVTQFTLGFTAFLFPGFDNSIRAFLMPYHVYFGNVILTMAIIAAATGINGQAIYSSTKSENVTSPTMLLNMAAISIIIFGMFVIYLTTKIHYKRQPRPADTPTAAISS